MEGVVNNDSDTSSRSRDKLGEWAGAAQRGMTTEKTPAQSWTMAENHPADTKVLEDGPGSTGQEHTMSVLLSRLLSLTT